MLSAAYVSAGVLNVVGDTGSANDLRVGYGSDRGTLVATVNGQSQSFPSAGVNKVTIVGGNAADRLVVAPDVSIDADLFGSAGNDLIYGGAGNDKLDGGEGDDSLAGGAGADTLVGRDGNDLLDGQADSDSLYGGAGYDRGNSGFWRADLEGGFDGLPADAPAGSGGGSTPAPVSGPVQLDNGVLKLTGADGRENAISVNYETGTGAYRGTVNDASETFAGGVRGVSITGGNRNDTIKLDADVPASATVHGGAGNDLIEGGAGADQLYGDSGNDVIYGGSGDDLLNGGSGDDSLDGGPGGDQSYGGGGRDRSNSAAWADGSIASGWSGYTGSTPAPTPTPTPAPSPADPTSPVPSDNSGKSPAARIDSSERTITAESAVFVQALNSTLNAGTPLTARYEWDFGDAGSRYNALVGFNASHVYDRPGTYTVTLRVFNENRKSDTATTTVTVKPDNRRVIYVSNSGSDSAAGTWDQPIKTWARASELVSGKSDLKVLLRAGETYEVRGSMVLSGDNVEIASYGTGSKPRLRWVGNGDRNSILRSNPTASHLTIRGLTFDSQYDSGDGQAGGLPFALKLEGTSLVARDNTFLNVNYAIQGSGAPVGMLVQDNDAPSITGIRGYFAWIDGQDWVLLGNKVVNVTREHTVRISGGQRILFHDNDLANLDRRTVDRYDTAKGVITVQSGSYAYMDGNRIAGPLPIGPLGEADGLRDPSSRWRWAVVEDNVITEDPIEVAHGAEHVMIRNNLLKVNGDQSIEVDGYNTAYHRGVIDVSVLNNTAYNASTIGRFIWFSGKADGVNLQNNLYVAPNLTTGAYHTAGVFINTDDLSGFNTIDHNVWPDPKTLEWAQGGINWVGGAGTGQEGYLTPAEWDALRAVKNDTFENAKVDGNLKPASSDFAATGGAVLPGVFTDFNGTYRDPSRPWSVGAVQA